MVINHNNLKSYHNKKKKKKKNTQRELLYENGFKNITKNWNITVLL
jgi:hypothetical protein